MGKVIKVKGGYQYIDPKTKKKVGGVKRTKKAAQAVVMRKK